MSTNAVFWTAVLAAVPISEVRGAIPYGVISGLPFPLVFAVAVLFNLLAFPITIIFLSFFHEKLCGVKFYKKHVDRYLERVHRKVHKKIERYGYLGLAIFVAIPLPLTGAYTGSAGSWLLGMDRKKSFIAVSIGVVVAAIIVSVIVLTGAEIFRIFVK
ncbi:MAG: small multi-drug export protein [Candidatus Woesearchaeota archaeon]